MRKEKIQIKNKKIILKVAILNLVIIAIYFISRLMNLTIIPVFADEAIYIRWAQVMRTEASLRFLPLSDGKQPLFMWLVIPFLKIIKDPLAAGRTVSVISGFGTMIGISVLSYLLFENTCFATFASIFYLTSPFAFFFDRMALVDGMLSFFGVWFLVFGLCLAKWLRLDLAMIAGIILGLALITKSPAWFFVFLLPTTILFFNFKRKNLPLQLGKLAMMWLVVYLFAFVIYNILRLGPEFHMISIRNKDYVFSFSEVLKHPLEPFWGNFKSIINWFWILFTPSVFVLGLVGIFAGLKNNFKTAIFLLVWLTAPLIGQSAVAKVFTARYVLFSLPFFLIFSTWSLETLLAIKNKKLAVFLGVAIFIFPIYQIYLLSTRPERAWLPKNERSGYFEGWTAGYGIKESSLYLKKVAEIQKVLVGTEGFFGTLPDGLQIYLEKVPNITVIGLGYPVKEIPEKLTNGLKDNRVFLLVNDTRLEVKDTSKLNLIAKYPKAENLRTGSQENLLFFEVLEE